jgi:hypothetical protein
MKVANKYFETGSNIGSDINKSIVSTRELREDLIWGILAARQFRIICLAI